VGLTCLPVFGPGIAGKFQFSGAAIRGRWTGKDDVTIEVYGATDCLHFAAGGRRHGDRGGLPQGGISEATFYNWRKKYSGLTPPEMKRLRQLEKENGKLKKIVADLSLAKVMLQDVIRRKL
jgi:putative transposase